MATLELPLSTEPNLGVWKVSAKAGDAHDRDRRARRGVRPPQVRGGRRAGQAVVPGRRADHRHRRRHLQLRQARERRADESRPPATSASGRSSPRFTADVVDGKADFEHPGGRLRRRRRRRRAAKGNVQLDITVAEQQHRLRGDDHRAGHRRRAPVNIQLIPETPAFKPGLPFNVLVVTETPDGQPVESERQHRHLPTRTRTTARSAQETQRVETDRGVGTAHARRRPRTRRACRSSAYSGDACAYKEVDAAYSPSGNFIHVTQLEPTDLAVGRHRPLPRRLPPPRRAPSTTRSSPATASSSPATSDSADIAFEVTPAMAGRGQAARLPDPAEQRGRRRLHPVRRRGRLPAHRHRRLQHGRGAARRRLSVDVQTEGRAKVGLVAVDRSVFILAENRLNLAAGVRRDRAPLPAAAGRTARGRLHPGPDRHPRRRGDVRGRRPRS